MAYKLIAVFAWWSFVHIDFNHLRRYRALEFRQPVTQGKHSVKRSIYKALHKRLSLVLRRWRPARTISYRPFLKHQRFAVWTLLLHSVSLIWIICIHFKVTLGFDCQSLQQQSSTSTLMLFNWEMLWSKSTINSRLKTMKELVSINFFTDI